MNLLTWAEGMEKRGEMSCKRYAALTPGDQKVYDFWKTLHPEELPMWERYGAYATGLEDPSLAEHYKTLATLAAPGPSETKNMPWWLTGKEQEAWLAIKRRNEAADRVTRELDSTKPSWQDPWERRVDPMGGRLSSNYASERLRRMFHLPMNAKDVRMEKLPNGRWRVASYAIGDPVADAEKRNIKSRTTNAWGDTYTEYANGGYSWDYSKNKNSPANRAMRRRNLLTAEGMVAKLSPDELMKKVKIGPAGGVMFDNNGTATAWGRNTQAAKIILNRMREIQDAKLQSRGLPKTDGTLEDIASYGLKGFEEKNNPYLQEALKRRQQRYRNAQQARVDLINQGITPGPRYQPKGYGEELMAQYQDRAVKPADFGEVERQPIVGQGKPKVTPSAGDAAEKAKQQVDANAGEQPTATTQTPVTTPPTATPPPIQVNFVKPGER